MSKSFLSERYRVADMYRGMPIILVHNILSFLPSKTLAKIDNTYAKKIALHRIQQAMTIWVKRRVKSCFPLSNEFEIQIPCNKCVELFTPMITRAHIRPFITSFLVSNMMNEMSMHIDMISEDEFDSFAGCIWFDSIDELVNYHSDSMLRFIWSNNQECYKNILVRLVDIEHVIEDELYWSEPRTETYATNVIHNTAIHILLRAQAMCVDKGVLMVSKWSWTSLVKECRHWGIDIGL